MRIALLGPFPLEWQRSPEDTPVPGGVDAVVLALARGLAASGNVALRVITAVPGHGAVTAYRGEGYEIVAVPHARGGRLTGQRQVVGLLREQVEAYGPDIAHGHIAGIYGRAALAAGVPAIITLHGIIYREMQQAWSWSSWPVRLRWLADARLERAVTEQAREIVAISPYVRQEARVRSDARFHLIENPVDDRFFVDAPPPPAADRLVCVARVIPRKGILALIEAFAEVRKQRPLATLVVAGETDSHPAYVEQCRRRAAELGVEAAVTLSGAASLDVVRGHLAAADLFVLASEQETAPVSIAEAMAVGRAVVTTDVGGCAGMVRDGVTGCVVPARDPAAFAAAVVSLLADPARCAQFGSAARFDAQRRFALAAHTQATLEAYAAVIERCRSEGRTPGRVRN